MNDPKPPTAPKLPKALTWLLCGIGGASTLTLSLVITLVILALHPCSGEPDATPVQQGDVEPEE